MCYLALKHMYLPMYNTGMVLPKSQYHDCDSLPASCFSRLEPLDGQDEVHCVAPLLTPNRLSLLLAEDAPRALELALKQWEGLKGAELEGEGQEFLDLLLQALALATLLHRVGTCI